ncbi:myelin expression factor 2-like [Limulus polyphemus]|uniref:Myelin expression factor 2-like n=1 Tax=Limulus polyphemus TaxID=6850 RepID=A0ABM1BFR4_LIMPO|nr:myelin expression factor 2-like [Limulus polyphemus]
MDAEGGYGGNGTSSPDNTFDQRSRSRSPVERNKERDRKDYSRDRGGDRRQQRLSGFRRVYVANIPFESKWTDIKDLFREQVGDVSYVELFNDENGKFRGCGIVEMKDETAAQKAIDLLHRYEYKGRSLVVKEDDDVERDRYGRPLKGTRERTISLNSNFGGGMDVVLGGMGSETSSQFNTYGLSPQFLRSLGIDGPLCNRVFVSNLEYKVTEDKLEEIFKLAGKVNKVDLKKDKDGGSRGCCVISYEHPAEAVQAISMFNNQKLYSRTMSVRMDKMNDEFDGLPSKLPGGLQGIGKGLGSSGQPLNITSLVTAASLGAGMLGGGLGLMGMNSMNAGVGNMGTGMGGVGMGMSTGNLSNMMASQSVGGMGGLNAAMQMGVTGDQGMMSSGIGGGLSGAMGTGMNMVSAAGLGMSNNSTGSGNMMGVMGGLDLGTGGTGNLGGGMNNFGDTDRLNFESRLRGSDTITVKNLPHSYNWQSLRDKFKDVGDVRYVEFKKGIAYIRFSSERDAQRAVDLMDGARIHGRSLEVQLY